MTLDAWIAGHARFSPDKIAIAFGEDHIDYRTLDRRIAETAAVLAGTLGLRHGDRIAYYGMNNPEMFVLVFAAARLGLILVPLNWRLAVPELQYIIGDCGPKALFYDRHFAGKVADIAAGTADCRTVAIHREDDAACLSDLRDRADMETAQNGGSPTDPVLIVYTSGTTGSPKGAVLSQAALRCTGQMSQHAYDMSSSDRLLNVLPLFHVGGLNIQPLPALLLGATLHLHEKFDPVAAVRAIETEAITLVNSVPTLLQAMIDSEAWPQADLSSLRSVSIGSTDVPIPLIEAVHARSIPLVQIYGATETGPIAIYQRAEHAVSTLGSIGRCGLLCEARLVGDDGRDVAQGEPGEIWIRGENILDQYWKNPEASAQNIVDGWFRTGDVARTDEAGNYWFVDRIKHVIISGGENIYPAELDRVLRDCPALREATVVGRADDKWGMVPVVVAVRNDPTVTRDDILQIFEGNVARFKRPRDVVFVDALPRNALGKVVMNEVRALV